MNGYPEGYIEVQAHISQPGAKQDSLLNHSSSPPPPTQFSPDTATASTSAWEKGAGRVGLPCPMIVARWGHPSVLMCDGSRHGPPLPSLALLPLLDTQQDSAGKWKRKGLITVYFP